MLFLKKLALVAGALMAVSAIAQTNPLWMRYCAISPDGQTIAFSYKGDIFTVPSQGGTAHQVTSNDAYDAYPVWSPDGQRIAFASAREGSLDVYIVDRQGGTPRRLTTDSGNETPLCFKADGETVLFEATDMPTAQSILFASRSFPQVYQVSTSGGRARLFSALPMQDLSINGRGDILYHDIKGYEDPYRKHHTSSITRDIWLNQDGKFTKLTSFNGEDRTPRWAPDGNAYYYLSEQDGTFNVYKGSIGGKEQQLTRHTKHPVRYLTVADNGTLCYSYNGEIYTLREGGEPQLVDITVNADRSDKELIRQIKSSGATAISVSPSGKEVAFVMHGDVYVTSVEYKTTKQITDTPEQERTIGFSPDGRSIVYDSERGGMWQIYQTSIKNKDEKLFTYCTDLVEEQLTNTGHTSIQPTYSPDGKSVAFLEDRATLRAVDVKSKAVRTLMDGKYIYSYSDGDVWYEWSPDSRWLLSSYIGEGGWNSQDVALVSASGNGEVHNLTQSGYNEGNAKWVLGGKAIIFSSDRAGYRSHGSWGSEDDVYIMFLDLDAYERFRMTKEEKVLSDEAEKEKKKEQETADKEKNDKKKNDKKKKKGAADDKPAVQPLVFDLENCQDRIARLTVNSSRLGDYVLSNGGDTLYYQAAFEGGMDLWKHDLRENKTEIVLKDVGQGQMMADKDGKNLFVCTGKGIKKIDLAKGKPEAVSYEANFNYRPQQEREYIFNHIWQQVKDKFYVEDIHGVDWEGYRENYKRFLPYINNNYDFRDMLSEMLGELNGSHTGARYNPGGPTLQTAALGLFLDNSYQGDGLRIEEVIKRGPFDVKKTGVTPGCIIEKIDGNKILAGEDYNWMLDGKAGKPIRVSVYDPKAGKRFDVNVKAISKGAQTELLYKRWVDRNRALVDSLSGGRLAYVHVKEMNSESFRTVYRELLSDKNRNRKAVIVDERHNGGGWLHDDLCTLLGGKQYQSFVPHGKVVGVDPFNKWTKPSCVLMCEDDYSNGHGFPFVYKELGIGKLIGTPVPGTMTAVWWETLIDSSLIFGIPQVGCRDMRGNYCENTPLLPDVEVYNTPEDYLSGHDRQLERAVQEMLK